MSQPTTIIPSSNGSVTIPAASSPSPSSSGAEVAEASTTSLRMSQNSCESGVEIDPVTSATTEPTQRQPHHHQQQKNIPQQQQQTVMADEVSGSISGTIPDSDISSFTSATNQEEGTLMKDDANNKPAKEDHVTTKEHTPIDSNNNSNSSDGGGGGEGQRVELEAQEKDALLGVATFTNNGSPSGGGLGTETTTTRRRVLATEGEGDEAEVATGTDDKAVQCNSAEEIMLKDWKEMPRYLQFNPYVLTGYRPLQNVSECFASLFYFHNETFNILTHGIPIVYILATVPSKLMWDDYRFLSWCHIVGSVAPWCGSFLYHLFMNVNRGETVYYTLLKLDMLGIWISQSFGALPMVTATVHCLNWPLKWLFIIMYSLLSIWGLYKAMCATSPWQRRLCFFLPFTMRVLLTMIRLTRFGGGNTTSMTHIFLQDAVSVVGGAIGAMHIPEKWFPGCMDYYLNSHNIMHVLVVLAVYSMHQATVQDLDWMSKAECLMGTTISLQEASITASSTDL